MAALDDLAYVLQLHRQGRINDAALNSALQVFRTPVPPAPRSRPTPAPRSRPAPATRSRPTPAPRSRPAPAPRSRPTPAPRSRPTPAPRPKPTPAPRKRKNISDEEIVDKWLRELFPEEDWGLLEAQAERELHPEEDWGLPEAQAEREDEAVYTVELIIVPEDKEGRSGEKGRMWEQRLRCQGMFTPKEAKHYKEALQDTLKPADDKDVQALIERLDMNDWFEVRGSLDCEVGIASMEPGDHEQPLDWATTGLREGGQDQPEIFSRWVAPKTRLWDSPDFRPRRCLPSAFLGRYKKRLESRRKAPHPDLTYEGLWLLARGKVPLPAENEPWEMCWADAVVWLRHWHLPGVAVDIHGNVVARYEPEKRNPHCEIVFAILVHNQHVWCVTREQKAFWQLYGSKPVITEAPKPRHSDTLSDRWPRPPTVDKQTVVFVDSAEELAAVATDALEMTLCLTGEEPEDLIRDLVQGYDIEPGALTCRNGTVDGFTIRGGGDEKEVNIRLRRALPGSLQGDQPEARGDWGEERYTKVMRWVEKVSNELCPRAALSHYSLGAQIAFGQYRRGPRSGLFTESVPEGQILGVDIARAYTGIMAGLPRLPVFSKFDDFRGPSGTILPHAFYLVWAHTTDPVLFPQGLDLVSGTVLLYAEEQSIKFSLVAELVPHKTVGHSIGKVLNELYEDSGLDDADKKQAANLSYGLAGRRYNKAAWGQLYQDKHEAENYANGRLRTELAPDLYLVIDQVKRELSEGYRPVSRLILDGMRILLHKLVAALGETAVAVRTDCVYTKASEDDARNLLLAAGWKFATTKPYHWHDVGCLTFDHTPKLPTAELKQFPCVEDPFDCEYRTALSCQRTIKMVNEWDDEEAKLIIEADMPRDNTAEEPQIDIDPPDIDPSLVRICGPNVPRVAKKREGSLLVTGKYPGTGKSSLAMRWARQADKKMLVVCPSNALADKVSKDDGFDAITLHTLVGRRPEGAEDIVIFKPTDVGPYEVILFEEVYFYTVQQLEWLATFVAKKRETHLIIANGDPAQNEPVMQELAVPFDAYYDEIMASIFPRRLELEIAKRYTADDRRRMEEVYDRLRDDNLSSRKVFQTAVNCGLRVVSWAEIQQDQELALRPQVAFTNATVARVNAWAHTARGLPENWQVGELVVGRKYARVAGKRKINSNKRYTVTAITPTHLTVAGLDGVERTMTLRSSSDLLRRPWCFTGHAIQGQTLGDSLCIHDANTNLITARWFRTAITRCRTLDIVLVTHDDPMRLSKRRIQVRIDAHKYIDREAGRPFDDKDFVTVDWALRRVESQRYLCHSCGEALDGDWSIDRKDNARAHVVDNCQVVCRRCQNASSHQGYDDYLPDDDLTWEEYCDLGFNRP